MNIEYTNLEALSAKDFPRMQREFDEAGASVMTVVLTLRGDVHVLSPFDLAWTRHYLLEAGCRLSVVSEH